MAARSSRADAPRSRRCGADETLAAGRLVGGAVVVSGPLPHEALGERLLDEVKAVGRAVDEQLGVGGPRRHEVRLAHRLVEDGLAQARDVLSVVLEAHALDAAQALPGDVSVDVEAEVRLVPVLVAAAPPEGVEADVRAASVPSMRKSPANHLPGARLVEATGARSR